MRAGEGLHGGEQTVVFVKPLQAHTSVTLCPENPDLLIEHDLYFLVLFLLYCLEEV